VILTLFWSPPQAALDGVFAARAGLEQVWTSSSPPPLAISYIVRNLRVTDSPLVQFGTRWHFSSCKRLAPLNGFFTRRCTLWNGRHVPLLAFPAPHSFLSCFWVIVPSTYYCTHPIWSISTRPLPGV